MYNCFWRLTYLKTSIDIFCENEDKLGVLSGQSWFFATTMATLSWRCFLNGYEPGFGAKFSKIALQTMKIR